MTPTITNSFISTALAAIQSTSDSQGSFWSPRTWFVEGAVMRAGPRSYLALNSGLSGTVIPKHSGGKASDGSISWAFISSNRSAQNLASNYYLTIGDGTGKDEFNALHNIKSAMRLNPRNMSSGCDRKAWIAGEIVEQWPSPNSYSTVGNSVYRCISNNAGAVSTATPAGNSLQYFELVDGYIWKYLGDISASDAQQFGTSQAIPIAPLYVDDSTTRAVIQSGARDGEISTFTLAHEVGTFAAPIVTVVGSGSGGSGRADITPGGNIRRVIATSPGMKYSPDAIAIIRDAAAVGSGADVTASVSGGGVSAIAVAAQGSGYTQAVVVIVGDGTGATATATVGGGYIISVAVTNAGTGYTKARAFVVPGTGGAVATAVMAPTGGHGRDMTKELPLNYLLVNRRLTSLDGLYIPSGEFNQVCIVTGVTTNSGTGEILVGPAHPTPGNLDVANIELARPIYIAGITAVEHTAAEDEEIKIALKLV